MNIMIKFLKYNITFLLINFNCLISFSQENYLHDTIVNMMHYKITKRHTNGKAKELCQFKRTGIYNYQDKFIIMPDSLFDFSIKNGELISFNKNGNKISNRYYINNIRKNRKFIFIKYGDWYGDCWYSYYIIGYPVKSTHGHPAW